VYGGNEKTLVVSGNSATLGNAGAVVAVGQSRSGTGAVKGQDVVLYGSSTTLGRTSNNYAQGGNVSASGPNAKATGGSTTIIPGSSTLGSLGINMAMGGTA